MFNKKICNESGMALVFVLIVIAVLSILGTSILTISLAETKMAVNEEKQLQAHYIARTGVDTVAKYIAGDVSRANTLPFTRAGSFGGGSYNIEVKKVGEKIRITSIGNMGTSNETIKLDMVSPNIDGTIFSNVIYSASNISVGSHITIDGPLQSTGTITPPLGYIYSVRQGVAIDPLSIVFPSLTNKGDLSIGNGNVNISSDAEYGDISSGPNGKLTFSNSASIPLKIVVNKFDGKGNISIIGTGKVFIFVMTSINIQTPHASNSNQLSVFVKDGGSFDVQAGGEFNGYIIAPGASVNMQSAHSTINGAVICNSFNYSNNQTVHYIPGDFSTDYTNSLVTNYKKLLYSN